MRASSFAPIRRVGVVLFTVTGALFAWGYVSINPGGTRIAIALAAMVLACLTGLLAAKASVAGHARRIEAEEAGRTDAAELNTRRAHVMTALRLVAVLVAFALLVSQFGPLLLAEVVGFLTASLLASVPDDLPGYYAEVRRNARARRRR